MRNLTAIMLILTTTLASAAEITIQYEESPVIYIWFPEELDNKSFVINSDGEVNWIGHTTPKLKQNKEGKIDWKQFHLDAKGNIEKALFSKKEYEYILNSCIAIIEKHPITNKSYGGPGYQAFSIKLGRTPELDYRFGSIGAENFPKEIFALTKYIREKLSPYQKIKTKDGAKGAPPS